MMHIGFGTAAVALAAFGLAASPALAVQEFYVGEPVVKAGLQIVPNYLTGVEMNAHVPGMEMGKDAIHLEADVHAAKDEAHSLAEDTWIPYLTITYTLTKKGSGFHKTGTLAAMVAKDGLHYANGVKMAGPGAYHLTYVISPPALYRHVDKASGVPAWWAPIKADWTFDYPSKSK
jgi:uncharacterized protein involved in high-affinity Fe2+ transport